MRYFLKHKVLEEFSLYEVVLTHFVKGGRIPLSLWMNSAMLYCFLNPIFSIRLLLTFKWLKCYSFYWLVLFTKILPLLPEALTWNLLLCHHWSFCFPNHLLRLLSSQLMWIWGNMTFYWRPSLTKVLNIVDHSINKILKRWN